MSRAKNQRPLAHRQLHGEAVFVCLRLLRHAGHAAVQRQHQPSRCALPHPPQHLCRRLVPAGIVQPRRAEQHRHVAAAGHAQLAVTGQSELPDKAAAAAGEQLLCQPDTFQLHSAAADGAGQQPLRAYQHLASLAPWRRAVVPDDGSQHGVLFLLPLIDQRLKDVVHKMLLCVVGIIPHTRPCGRVWEGQLSQSAAREWAVSAAYCSAVRSQ